MHDWMSGRTRMIRLCRRLLHRARWFRIAGLLHLLLIHVWRESRPVRNESVVSCQNHKMVWYWSSVVDESCLIDCCITSYISFDGLCRRICLSVISQITVSNYVSIGNHLTQDMFEEGDASLIDAREPLLLSRRFLDTDGPSSFSTRTRCLIIKCSGNLSIQSLGAAGLKLKISMQCNSRL